MTGRVILTPGHDVASHMMILKHNMLHIKIKLRKAETIFRRQNIINGIKMGLLRKIMLRLIFVES